MNKGNHNSNDKKTSDTRHWYVFRFYHNCYESIEKEVLANNYEIYYPIDPSSRKISKTKDNTETVTYRRLLPSIAFVRCDSEFAERGYRKQRIQMSVLTKPNDNDSPVIVPDIEMITFRLAIESGCNTFERILEENVIGEHVRVIDGIFKGAEGYIVKIHCDKRFVIKIEGVAAFATIYLPPYHFVSIDNWYILKLKNANNSNALISKLHNERINFVVPTVWNGSERVNVLVADDILVKCESKKLDDFKSFARPVINEDNNEPITLSDVTVSKLKILATDSTYSVKIINEAYVNHALYQCLIKGKHSLAGLKAYKATTTDKLFVPIEKVDITLEISGVEAESYTLQSINQPNKIEHDKA